MASKSRSSQGQPSRKLETVIYTPESRLRHPVKFLQEMWADLLASRNLARQLLIRDIKAQYRQSWLGYIWAFVPAITAGAGLAIAKSSNIINVAETDIPYAAYVMLSMTLWQTFTQSIQAPIAGISGAKAVLAKINIPPEALVLARIGQVLFNFCIKLILIVSIFVWFRIPVSWGTLAAPAGLLHMIALGTAIGLFLTPIASLYTDVSKLLGYAINGWLLVTPVIYPQPETGVLAAIVRVNPVADLLVTTRELATGLPLSDPAGFWITSGVSFLGLFVAWIFFRLSMPFIIERMST